MATFLADANPYTIMSFASVAIALMAFMASMFFNRRTEKHGYLQRVEDRNAELLRMVDKLERDVAHARLKIDELMQENILLLRKAAGIIKEASDRENP